MLLASRVEVRDVGQHPTMYRTALHNKVWSGQNVNSINIEKPWSKGWTEQERLLQLFKKMKALAEGRETPSLSWNRQGHCGLVPCEEEAWRFFYKWRRPGTMMVCYGLWEWGIVRVGNSSGNKSSKICFYFFHHRLFLCYCYCITCREA